ncbi:MAG: RDD family protein [Pyrinomonadaceae bacterium]
MFQDFQTPAYAGFWMRGVAYIIDSLIMSIIFVPLGFVIGLLMVGAGLDENSPEFQMINLGSNGFSLLAGWLYHAFMESSSWQGTVGKKALGLRVTDLSGSRISFARATGRYFGMILSGMICFIGFIMVAFTEKKQGLHDMLAGTLVLSGPAPASHPLPPPPPDFSCRQSEFL